MLFTPCQCKTNASYLGIHLGWYRQWLPLLCRMQRPMGPSAPWWQCFGMIHSHSCKYTLLLPHPSYGQSRMGLPRSDHSSWNRKRRYPKICFNTQIHAQTHTYQKRTYKNIIFLASSLKSYRPNTVPPHALRETHDFTMMSWSTPYLSCWKDRFSLLISARTYISVTHSPHNKADHSCRAFEHGAAQKREIKLQTTH